MSEVTFARCTSVVVDTDDSVTYPLAELANAFEFVRDSTRGEAWIVRARAFVNSVPRVTRTEPASYRTFTEGPVGRCMEMPVG